MNPVLIAGVGNIFHGDDGFGVEVAHRLATRRAEFALPPGIDIADYGIRGVDLAYAITGGYRLVIIVDTVQRGGAPGTLYAIAPEIDAGAGFDDAGSDGAGDIDGAGHAMSPHEMDPARVLRLVHLLGGERAEVMLVGCEPVTFGDQEDGRIGLSPEVEDAVDRAAAMAVRLATGWLQNAPAIAGNACEEHVP